MTRPSQFRSGSALLIVLGMVAFMLFSGLAFSVYMRYARLPTSFLRRTTTTHQLAKAALAEAIEEIDKAIGGDPHPGVQKEKDVGKNYWYNRVFFGEKRETDPEYDSNTTVATLTLEGLAYLPPNMINDVRYYSRCTPTAKWHSFWFDSGRYAYTAVDVSDYLDINRLVANQGRASSASRRITLAHLFETDGTEHSGAGDDVKNWDKRMEDEGVRTVNTTTGKVTIKDPFVSLADFNVAWADTITFSGKAVECPFRCFVKDGKPYKQLESSGTQQPYEAYKNLTFVTESWTPADSVAKTPDGKKEPVDLATEQPFKLDALETKGPSLYEDVIMYRGTKLMQAYPDENSVNLRNNLSGLGIVQLWDYLDPNNIPVSLAIPTLERTPMIVGVQPMELSGIKIEKGERKDSEVSSGNKTRVYRREQTYNLKLDGQKVVVRLLAAYPFRTHGVKEKDDSFQLDGRIAIFFTVDGQNMSLRPNGATQTLQLKKDNLTTGGYLNNSALSIPLSARDVNASDIAENKNGEQPVTAVSLEGKTGEVKDSTKFLTIAYEWTQTQTDAGAWVPENPTEKDIVENGTEFAFCPLSPDGTLNKAPKDFAANLKNGAGVKLRVNAAVWARVSQNEEDTVDLVPACCYDDNELNKVRVSRAFYDIEPGSSPGCPLLRYDVKAGGQDGIEMSIAKLDAGLSYPLSIDRPKAFVSDPRYNHLPENWYTIAGNDAISEQEWMTEAAKMVGKDGRDKDIFMFTSDQGYMQSVYELAFLPRFGGLTTNTRGESMSGNYVSSRNKEAESRQSLATDYSQALDVNTMWRTYRCYGSDRDDFENIGLVSGATGPHVNPYSDSTNVLMAAFANTPHDWRCSSTNDNSVAKTAKDAATFNGQYAWNAYSSDDTGKIGWGTLSNLAGAFSYHVRNVSGSKWQDIFASLDWEASGVDVSKRNRYLAGIELDSDDSNLYDVDKKFLYGFWHDSFGTGQQLFLIFVRAEPMMMGGGVAGQAPPQLGARAVALVWRDPSGDTLKAQPQQGSTQNAGVHRTRILFYHQFD